MSWLSLCILVIWINWNMTFINNRTDVWLILTASSQVFHCMQMNYQWFPFYNIDLRLCRFAICGQKVLVNMQKHVQRSNKQYHPDDMQFRRALSLVRWQDCIVGFFFKHWKHLLLYESNPTTKEASNCWAAEIPF